MDYAKEASQIYDPQAEAEKEAVGAQHKGNLLTVEEEASKIDPLYSKAFKNLEKIRKQEGFRQDHLYSSALSGQATGLLGNQQRILGTELMEDTQELEESKAADFAKIASRKRLYNEEYQAGIKSIISKYAGVKNEYIFTRQEKERERAFAASENEKNRQASMSAARMSAPTTPAAPDPASNAKADAVAWLEKAYESPDTVDTFYRDRVYSFLKSKYGGSISASDLKNLVYKNVFPDNWFRR